MRNHEKNLAILNWLKGGDEFLLVSHIHPDGDATGSLIAMGEILAGLKKKAVLVNDGVTPARFSFLDGYIQIQNVSQAPLTKKYRRLITVDCADWDRIGKVAEAVDANTEILNIDHHPTNDHFGHYHLILPEASSTCEVIFDWLRDVELPLTPPLAEALYTGYLTDTGGFRYSNTNSKVLLDASVLVQAGANPYKIAENALETTTYAHLNLLSRVLSTLEIRFGGKVAFLTVPLSLLQETSANKEDTDGLVNYGRNIEGVEVAVLLRESEEGVKVSFRSKAEVDVSLIAKKMGGGGHVRASGVFLKRSLPEARRDVESILAPLFEGEN
ncbi:MAG: bifunctional oligoribonuclease/PAP phosphatase NrnA [Thermicanus sp.]|nr:bifunctional oligoribonuclease/PAP phosphatase NrnA [Thermicanus sp.]